MYIPVESLPNFHVSCSFGREGYNYFSDIGMTVLVDGYEPRIHITLIVFEKKDKLKKKVKKPNEIRFLRALRTNIS